MLLFVCQHPGYTISIPTEFLKPQIHHRETLAKARSGLSSLTYQFSFQGDSVTATSHQIHLMTCVYSVLVACFHAEVRFLMSLVG